MKVLVTGGSGFIGSALCRKLVAAGFQVRILDNHSRGALTKLGLKLDQVEVVEGDITHLDTVRRAAEGCEILWHLAYINGTRFFYERPDEVLEVAVKGSINTLDAALAAGVRRYVLASSSEVYNQPTRLPTDENERLLIPDVRNPRFSYGGGKIAAELLTLHYGGRRGLETVIFRPHNFYGPDMGFEHVIPEVVKRIMDLSEGLTRREIDLPIQGDGSETRAFCYVEDGADGILLAGTRGLSGEIYHVGVAEEISIRQLIEAIGQVLGIRLNLQPGGVREGAPSRRCPAIDKLKGLGYAPRFSFADGIRETVQWYARYYNPGQG